MSESIITEWGDLFAEIAYAYESQYCQDMTIETDPDGRKYLNVYKLTIWSDGTFEYKGHVTKYNADTLWPRVVLFAQLWNKNNKSIEVLYGNKK